MYRGYQGGGTGSSNGNISGGIGNSGITGPKASGLTITSANTHNKAAFLAKPGFKHTANFGPGKRFLNQCSTGNALKNIRRIPPPANVPSLQAQQRRFAASHLRPTSESTQWNVKSNEKPAKTNGNLWGQQKSTATAAVPSTDFPDLKHSPINKDLSSSSSIQQRLAKAANSLSNWKVESASIKERPSVAVSGDQIDETDDSNWIDTVNHINYDDHGVFSDDEKIEAESLSKHAETEFEKTDSTLISSDNTVELPVEKNTLLSVDDQDFALNPSKNVIECPQDLTCSDSISLSQANHSTSVNIVSIKDTDISRSSSQNQLPGLSEPIVSDYQLSTTHFENLDDSNIETIHANDEDDGLQQPVGAQHVAINYHDLPQFHSTSIHDLKQQQHHHDPSNNRQASQQHADAFPNGGIQFGNKTVITPNMIVGNARPHSNDNNLLYNSCDQSSSSPLVDPIRLMRQQQGDKFKLNQQMPGVVDNRGNFLTEGFLFSKDQIAAAVAIAQGMYSMNQANTSQHPQHHRICYQQPPPSRLQAQLQQNMNGSDIIHLNSTPAALSNRITPYPTSANLATINNQNFNRNTLIQQLIAANPEAFGSQFTEQHNQINSQYQNTMQSIAAANQQQHHLIDHQHAAAPLHLLPDRLAFLSSQLRNSANHTVAPTPQQQPCIINPVVAAATAMMNQQHINQPSNVSSHPISATGSQLFCPPSLRAAWSQFPPNQHAAAQHNLLPRDIEFLNNAAVTAPNRNRHDVVGNKRQLHWQNNSDQQQHHLQHLRFLNNSNNMPHQQQIMAAAAHPGEQFNQQNIINNRLSKQQQIFQDWQHSVNPSSNDGFHSSVLENMALRMRTSEGLEHRNQQSFNAQQHRHRMFTADIEQRHSSQSSEVINADQIVRQLRDLQINQQQKQHAVQSVKSSNSEETRSLVQSSQQNATNNLVPVHQLQQRQQLQLLPINNDSQQEQEFQKPIMSTDIRQDLDGEYQKNEDEDEIIDNRDIAVSDECKLDEVKTCIFTPSKSLEAKKARNINERSRRSGQYRSVYDDNVVSFRSNDIKRRRRIVKRQEKQLYPSDHEEHEIMQHHSNNENKKFGLSNRRNNYTRPQNNRKERPKNISATASHRNEDSYDYRHYDDNFDNYHHSMYRDTPDVYYDINRHGRTQYRRHEFDVDSCEPNYYDVKRDTVMSNPGRQSYRRSANRSNYRGRYSSDYFPDDILPSNSKIEVENENYSNSNKQPSSKYRREYNRRTNYSNNNRKSSLNKPVQIVRPVVSTDVQDDISKSWDSLPALIHEKISTNESTINKRNDGSVSSHDHEPTIFEKQRALNSNSNNATMSSINDGKEEKRGEHQKLYSTNRSLDNSNNVITGATVNP
ncbi:hypothetical protein GJ496_002314 [Pomphorhynchus laevis]|nr:hypothetical protein GJ496_002314 [Pomphorhynchus laevis]